MQADQEAINLLHVAPSLSRSLSLHFDDVHVRAVGAGLEVRRAPRVRVRHVALERDVLSRSADRRVRLRVEVLITPRVRPRQPIHGVGVVVRVDPRHHDFVLVQLPSARRRRRIIPRVVKPLRTRRPSGVEEGHAHPRLLRVPSVAHMPARLVVEQAYRRLHAVDLPHIQPPSARAGIRLSRKGVVPVHSRFPHSLQVPSPAKSMITLLSGVRVTPCKQELFGEPTLPVHPVVYTGPLLFAAKLYTNTFSGLAPLVSPPTTTTCCPSWERSVLSMKLMAAYSLNWCTVAAVTVDPLIVPFISEFPLV